MTGEPTQASGSGSAAGCAIEQRHIGAVCVVSVSGTLDMLTAPQLDAVLTAAARRTDAVVIVDLSAVDFLASAGMGVLVAAHAELEPEVRLVVVADGPATARPLKLVGIADLVELFATLDQALAAVAA